MPLIFFHKRDVLTILKKVNDIINHLVLMEFLGYISKTVQAVYPIPSEIYFTSLISMEITKIMKISQRPTGSKEWLGTAHTRKVIDLWPLFAVLAKVMEKSSILN